MAQYFLTDAALPEVCRERTLLYHQVGSLVASGAYICTPAQYVRFAALVAQISYGNRDAAKHVPGFLRLHEYLPVEQRSREAEVLRLWDSLAGTSREQAICEYTRVAMSEVPTYGVTRFPVSELGKDRRQGHELGISQGCIFRIADGAVLEQIRLEELRTWNFTPKTIEFEFVSPSREKYVAGTARGREILAMLSEYQVGWRGGYTHPVSLTTTLSTLIARVLQTLTRSASIFT